MLQASISADCEAVHVALATGLDALPDYYASVGGALKA